MTLHAVERAGMVDDIVAGCSPAQFLQRRFSNRNEIASPSDGFDMACAAALCGDVELAVSTFHEAREAKHSRAAQFGRNRDHDAFLADIDTALRALDKGPEEFQAYIDRASQAAAIVHGFRPPTIP